MMERLRTNAHKKIKKKKKKAKEKKKKQQEKKKKIKNLPRAASSPFDHHVNN